MAGEVCPEPIPKVKINTAPANGRRLNFMLHTVASSGPGCQAETERRTESLHVIEAFKWHDLGKIGNFTGTIRIIVP
jgi:hypothetical protein